MGFVRKARFCFRSLFLVHPTTQQQPLVGPGQIGPNILVVTLQRSRCSRHTASCLIDGGCWVDYDCSTQDRVGGVKLK